MSLCIKLTNRTGCFFNVGSLLFSLFSKPVMLWSLVTITLVSCSGGHAVHSCSLLCVAKLASEVFLVLVFIAQQYHGSKSSKVRFKLR